MTFKKSAVIVLAVAVCSFSQINLTTANGINITTTGSSTKGLFLNGGSMTLNASSGLGGMGFLAGIITFRSMYQSNSTTYHYGDLEVKSGNYSGWGNLNVEGVITSNTYSSMSGPIAIRASNAASNTTTHFGDLTLSGGDNGTSWGWLTANKIYCYGDIDCSAPANKHFIQPHPTDSTKEIAYVTIEAGEPLTLVRGTAKTVNGAAEITLAEDFSLVTSSDAPLTVLLTPKKLPVLLCVTNESKDKITVAMKYQDLRDFGDVEFCYQVTGVREGYENYEPIRDIDPKMNNVKDDKSPASLKKKAFVEKAMKFRERKEKIMKERR